MALDELATNGRPNAEKIVLFMTDGHPNLPAPSNYYKYSQYTPYTKCTDMVNNSSAVKALCYKNGSQTICPSLPSSAIKDNMISQSATGLYDHLRQLHAGTNQHTNRIGQNR